MNKITYIVYNLSGEQYDHIMNNCPSWVWTDEEFEDYFKMMTGN
jgi:hypothetical protein